MACAEALRVQAYFDGELDAGAALEIEQHLAHCGDCAGLLQDLKAMRGALRAGLTYYRADESLRSRVAKVFARSGAAEGRTQHRRPFWQGLASGIAGTAIAASLAVFAVLPLQSDPLVADIVNAHMRSLMSDHLIDVASSDHHTVKPWFSSHADVSPPVADFVAESFRLVGGRADFVDGHRASVVVYRHGGHVINVFAWASGGARLPAPASRDGYHLLFWRQGTLDFAAVSDMAGDEMADFVRLLKKQTNAAE
jgi:anti-sigma factor RsiW